MTYDARTFSALSSRFFQIVMLSLFATAFFGSLTVHADPSKTAVLSNWQTIDDQSGEAKSIVRVYLQGDTLKGRVVKLNKLPANTLCANCRGPLKNKPIVGMDIIEGMKYNAKAKLWEGGTITDPKTGKQYPCKVWYANGQLMVRGYIGMFYRTQTWQKP